MQLQDHALCEDTGSSGEAEWMGLEFVYGVSEEESEEFAMIWSNRYLEVGIA